MGSSVAQAGRNRVARGVQSDIRRWQVLVELVDRIWIDQSQFGELERFQQNRFERFQAPGLRQIRCNSQEDGLRRTRAWRVVTEGQSSGFATTRHDFAPVVN